MIRRPLRKNKKGSVQDVMYIMVSLVVIVMISLLVYKIFNEVNKKFQDSTDIPQAGKTASNEIENQFTGVLDNSFMLLFIGLCIVAIALAAMVRIHPVFFVFFLILLVILIFLSGVFSNIYQKIASNPEMDDANNPGSLLAENLTYMTYIMRFLPFITGIIGFIMAFVMYKSAQGG